MRQSDAKPPKRGTDHAVVAAFALAALVLGWQAVREHAHNAQTLRLAAVGRYNASADEVMGVDAHVRGDRDCAFTLVEFGDYQCGPCRAAVPRLQKLLARHGRDIRFIFRDLPLTRIHPLAMRAAIITDTAGSAPDFWSVHDLLYSGATLEQSTLERAQRLVGGGGTHPLAENAARDRIRASADEAASLGIQGTPTFVLVCPHGIVRRVAALEQVEGMVAAAGVGTGSRTTGVAR